MTKPTHCTCPPNAEEYCPYCMRQSALDAGIPASVYDGETKLSDHFSPEYIRSQCTPTHTKSGWPVLTKQDLADEIENINNTFRQPDIDICSECGEHAEFDENGSECCGAGAYDTDPDTDMER